MAKKKKETAPEAESKEQTTKMTEAPAEERKVEKAVETPKQEAEKPRQKREPQMVTVNGDKVTHAHIYKSNQSDDWFFTAKINDVPLKPQKMSQSDTEAVLNKTVKPVELMEKYYPTKLMPKVPEVAFKVPNVITTPNGQETVLKFNVYKEKEMQSPDYGKYRFYAQVGDMRISETASKADLNAYFDRTMTPGELVAKVFGERLHMADHYKQFKLPEGAGIDAKDIRVMKNNSNNRYEISVNLGDAGRTRPREISYDDRQSYFTHKTATKEQLAAKYLGQEIASMLKAAPKLEMAKAPSLGI